MPFTYKWNAAQQIIDEAS